MLQQGEGRGGDEEAAQPSRPQPRLRVEHVLDTGHVYIVHVALQQYISGDFQTVTLLYLNFSIFTIC